MTELRDASLLPSDTAPLIRTSPKAGSSPSGGSIPTAQPQLTSAEQEEKFLQQGRKLSPGLAARLKALGFGKETKSPGPSSLNNQIGRIPEHQIRQLDASHIANSWSNAQVSRRGRAWSRANSLLTPQLTGSSFSDSSFGDSQLSEGETPRRLSLNWLEDNAMTVDPEQVDVDSQKYRLPDHTNGNGTKAMSETKQAHIEREITVEDRETVPPPPPIEKDDHPPPPIEEVVPPPPPIEKDNPPPIEETKPPVAEKEAPPPVEKVDVPPIENEVPTPSTPPAQTAVETPPSAQFSPQTEVQSYFNPFGLARAGSIYTLSRVSFTNQLAQLTSLQLPDAELLSTEISAIPGSKAAAQALIGAASQISSWISKASDVIAGLDGDDDVEWAAAGGREGLEEVDGAISRFEGLIKVYVSAIEALQSRSDIAAVPPTELKSVVKQMEGILSEWTKIRKTLKGVKNSVEIAMEWEELWDTVLGDIGSEMDILARLVFEMEEKRHKSMMTEAGTDEVNLNELETIVEETPTSKTQLLAAGHFIVPTSLPLSPMSPNPSTMPGQDDSSLLALFARMQPLRASLDFLPMRLSTFHLRAEDIFPTACDELEEKRAGLEASWTALEKDAESLRRELGEDRWVLVFRGAGRQAQKMYESVERSVAKLRESIDAGSHLNNPATTTKRTESYEAKKTYYGPAIDRVLSIIEKGVKDRLTVNGEILRVQTEMQRKWDVLKELMVKLDLDLEELQAEKKSQQLRDSISSMVSMDRSTIGSTGTPGSSPASSVVMTGLNGGFEAQHASKDGKARLRGEYLPRPKQNFGSPASSSRMPPKKESSRMSAYRTSISTASLRRSSSTPTGSRLSRSTASLQEGRPRWNPSVNTAGTLTGHNFKPLSATTPSPYARTPPSIRSAQSESRIPLRSPLSRDATKSPTPSIESTPSRTSRSRLAIRDRSSPGPYSQQTLSQFSPSSRPRQLAQSPLSAHSTPNKTPNRRQSSLQLSPATPTSTLQDSPTIRARPASSMSTNKRASYLPSPRGRPDSSVTGRESPNAIAGAASAMRRGSSQAGTNSKETNRPVWRG